MRHSIFDKIFLGFLFLSIAVFGLTVFYSTYATRQTLIEERTEVLTNETFLIADQTISSYIQGMSSLETLQASFDYYSDTLNASIWLFDGNGFRIASSRSSEHPSCPRNIYLLNPDF